MAEAIAEPEQKFIEEQLVPIGGMFGEQICHISWVDATPNLKTKTYNKRILVVGRFRILLVKKGKFGKSVENNVHLYNIVDVSSTEAEEKVEIKFYNDVEKQTAEGGVVIKASSKQALIQIIKALRSSYRSVTYGFPDKYLLKFNVNPDRMEPLDPSYVPSQANGLIDQYIALSHYYKTKVTLDYVRYIEALVQNRAIDLDFSECPGIDPQSELAFNLFTAIVSLRHNTYFRSIRVVKLPHINIVNAVGMVLETNNTITRVVLKDLRTEQSLVPIGRALAANPENSLTCLTLSGNIIGAQSLTALCDGFEKMTHGLSRLDLSRCQMRPKGIEILFNSFERNFGLSLSLQHLDLSDNNFSETGSIALASWLSKAKGYNALKSLVLSNCNLNFGIMGPPLRVIDLKELDLSRNRIEKAAAKLVADVLECVPTLKSVNLSQCRLAWEAAEDLFQGLARNKPLIAKTGVLAFNLEANQLGPRGGLMVARALPQLSYLGTLNLANNRIGAKTLTEFAVALQSNKWINSLDISGNITGAADTDTLCNHLRDYISTHPNLKSLSIAGTAKFGLGKVITPILEVMAGNSSITYLNISENNIGDVGASVLAESLRTNKGITTLITNLNHFSFTGWTTIAAPVLFRTNTTLATFPTPLTQHTPDNTPTEPYTSYTGDMKDQLLDLFARLQYRLLANSPTPPKTLREPPRPIPTQVERAADVPEHLLAMAPPKATSPTPYSPANQRLHEVTETGDIGGPTSKEDWGEADKESWGDDHADTAISEDAGSAEDFDDDSEEKTPKLDRKGIQKDKDKKDKDKDKKEKEKKEREAKEAKEKEAREKAAEEIAKRDKEEKDKKDQQEKERQAKELEQEELERKERELQEEEERKERERQQEEERQENERAEEERKKQEREDEAEKKAEEEHIEEEKRKRRLEEQELEEKEQKELAKREEQEREEIEKQKASKPHSSNPFEDDDDLT